MKRLLFILASLGIFFGTFLPTYAVSTFITQQGGTGTTSPSGILYGDNSATTHLNTVTIGSNLTFAGGTLSASSIGSGTVSTSTIPTVGQLAYWTSNAFPSLLGSVSTTTHTFSSSFTTTGTLGYLVGGTPSTVDLSNTGVTAGTYGTSTSTPQLTVDAQGRLSSVTDVPIAIAGSKAYYAYATQATSSAVYFNMNPTATTTSTTVAYPLTTSPQTVQNWISPVGDPGITVIPGGSYIVDLFAWRSSGSASITLAVQVWEVSSTGADISQIGTTNSTPNLTNAKAQYQVSFTTLQHTMASSASRILMRVVATTSGTPTLSLAMGDGDQMDLTTPGATVDVTNFVPYTGATANVNLGSFNASTTQLTVSSNTYLPLTGLLKGNGAGNAVTTGSNGTDYTLITANTCGAANHFSAVTAAGVFTCSADSGTTFGQSLEIDSIGYLAATTTNKYGFSTAPQGTTYGYAIGDQLFAYASSSNADTILGLYAGGQNATTSNAGAYNTAIGYQALTANTTGLDNVAIGRALVGNTTGTNGISIGVASLFANTTGNQNIGIGGRSLLANTIGMNNIAVGYQAGGNITTGYDNIHIGNTLNQGGNNIITGGGNIGLGYNIVYPSTSQNLMLNIGNSIFANLLATSTSTSLPTTFPGVKFGIASSTPVATLSIGTGTASSSASVAEYAYGATGNNATSTAATLSPRTSNSILWPMGTAATTLTLCNFQPGDRLLVRVTNPNATAGALTWAACTGEQLYWPSKTVPTQTTTANDWDLWSFYASASVGSTTAAIMISGSQGAGY